MSHKMLRPCIVKVSPVLGVHFPLYGDTCGDNIYDFYKTRPTFLLPSI